MKNFTKIIALFVFVGLSYFSNAQNEVITNNTSTPNSCDGYAYLADSSLYQGWTWYASDSTLIESNTTMVAGLCPGNYSVQVMINGAISTYYFTIGSGVFDPCAGFYAYAYSTPLSSPNACDGTAYTSVQGGTAPYSYVWDNGQTSSQIGNLCAGILNLTVTDANGCAFTSATFITADSSTNWNYALSGYVYTTSPSMDGLCDGTAYVDVYGGTAPYTFTHSNGDVTQSPAGLCAGIYSVIVTDANSDSMTLNYVVADPSDVFNGGNYNDSTIVDTLGYSAIEDCMIDYLTLDTAFVSDIAYISNDSIVVTWSVIDGNGTINFLQSYTISGGLGVYDLILQIFCPQKSSSDYVYAHDQIFFNPGLAKVDKIAENEFNVYPNPFVNSLKIDLEENTKSNVSITDITGKVIFNANYNVKNIEINVDAIAKGQYFLTVSNNGTQKTQIIVKQ